MMDVLRQHVSYGESSDDSAQGPLMTERGILMYSERRKTRSKINLFLQCSVSHCVQLVSFCTLPGTEVNWYKFLKHKDTCCAFFFCQTFVAVPRVLTYSLHGMLAR